jgi:tetratricopeptide (TPR) repeat protein
MKEVDVNSGSEKIEPVRRPRKAAAIWVLVGLAPLFALAFWLQVRMDERFGVYRATEEILYIENGELLRRVLLGYENLAADLYWLRAVQYYGGKRVYEPEKRFDLLEPLLQITTDLDPKLYIAYSYGAIFLSETFPKGAGIPLKGVELMDKGIRNNPDRWRFYLDKGFVYYWYLRDYKKAAEIFLEGSELPGAPYWMAATAGRALTRGGHRETARQLWKVLYDTAENDQMRANALVNLQQLDALDHIDLLQAVAESYREATGSFPTEWGELIEAGLINEAPSDPSGTPYVLNPMSEKVEVSRRSSLAGLPFRDPNIDALR